MSNINTWSVDQAVPLAPKGRGSIDLEIDFLNLMPGTYYAGVEVASMYDIHDSLENVVKIDLEPSDYYGTGRGVEERFGLVFFQLPEHALCSNTVLNSTRAKSYPNLFDTLSEEMSCRGYRSSFLPSTVLNFSTGLSAPR